MLKPQDIVIVLKLCEYSRESRPSYGRIAADLNISQSETHSAIKRLKQSHLIHGTGERPNLTAIEDFLFHGVKYSFPAVRGELTRGMPTSYAAPPLNRMIELGNEPIPVWPDPEGEKRGVALIPLYKTVPQAARRDPLLYERLALVDALRDGRTRERNLAEKELKYRLEQMYG